MDWERLAETRWIALRPCVDACPIGLEFRPLQNVEYCMIHPIVYHHVWCICVSHEVMHFYQSITSTEPCNSQWSANVLSIPLLFLLILHDPLRSLLGSLLFLLLGQLLPSLGNAKSGIDALSSVDSLEPGGKLGVWLNFDTGPSVGVDPSEDCYEHVQVRQRGEGVPLISAMLYLSPTSHSPLPRFRPSSRTEYSRLVSSWYRLIP